MKIEIDMHTRTKPLLVGCLFLSDSGQRVPAKPVIKIKIEDQNPESPILDYTAQRCGISLKTETEISHGCANVVDEYSITRTELGTLLSRFEKQQRIAWEKSSLSSPWTITVHSAEDILRVIPSYPSIDEQQMSRGVNKFWKAARDWAEQLTAHIQRLKDIESAILNKTIDKFMTTLQAKLSLVYLGYMGYALYKMQELDSTAVVKMLESIPVNDRNTTQKCAILEAIKRKNIKALRGCLITWRTESEQVVLAEKMLNDIDGLQLLGGTKTEKGNQLLFMAIHGDYRTASIEAAHILEETGDAKILPALKKIAGNSCLCLYWCCKEGGRVQMAIRSAVRKIEHRLNESESEITINPLAMGARPK